MRWLQRVSSSAGSCSSAGGVRLRELLDQRARWPELESAARVLECKSFVSLGELLNLIADKQSYLQRDPADDSRRVWAEFFSRNYRVIYEQTEDDRLRKIRDATGIGKQRSACRVAPGEEENIDEATRRQIPDPGTLSKCFGDCLLAAWRLGVVDGIFLQRVHGAETLSILRKALDLIRDDAEFFSHERVACFLELCASWKAVVHAELLLQRNLVSQVCGVAEACIVRQTAELAELSESQRKIASMIHRGAPPLPPPRRGEASIAAMISSSDLGHLIRGALSVPLLHPAHFRFHRGVLKLLMSIPAAAQGEGQVEGASCSGKANVTKFNARVFNRYCQLLSIRINWSRAVGKSELVLLLQYVVSRESGTAAAAPSTEDMDRKQRLASSSLEKDVRRVVWTILEQNKNKAAMSVVSVDPKNVDTHKKVHRMLHSADASSATDVECQSILTDQVFAYPFCLDYVLWPHSNFFASGM
ncbi:unnamed protein product [Amoebophrya sp. A120]|nr:unnamed protein product [Amoebophrya sp. A120]|eukprot:GSA120T00011682001.1